MDLLKVCLLDPRIEERHVERVMNVSPNIEAFLLGNRDDRSSLLREAHVVFGNPAPHELERAVALRWLHLVSAGVDGYTTIERLRSGAVMVTNSQGCYGVPIAEHVMAMMLALARRIPVIVRHQEQRVWQRPAGMAEIHGKTVGVLGLGDIGMEVSRRAKAFGMKVLAVKRRPAAKPGFVDELYGSESVDRVIQEADVLVLCLPATPWTEGILSAERINRMKPGAWVINVGRGKSIDQQALITALASGRIGGAALDVFAEEPLDRSSPLWSMENVIISPHTAGASPHLIDRSLDLFCRNLARFLRSEPLENVVDFDRGY